MSGSWYNRKRDCFNYGWSRFCYAFWCPSCAMAEAKHDVDDSSCCLNWWCMFGPAIRNSIRFSYELNGNAFEDCCYSCCCPQCAAVQLLNEASRRGPIRGRKVEVILKPASTAAPPPVEMAAAANQMAAAQMAAAANQMAAAQMGGQSFVPGTTFI